MGYVRQKSSRFELSNFEEASITIGGKTYRGYFADGKYVDPHEDDQDDLHKVETVFLETQTSAKLYAPNPPFDGTDGVSEEETFIIDLLKEIKNKVAEFHN